MIEVKKASAVTIPFVMVDAADFNTPETGITAPTVYCSKNGGAATQVIAPAWGELDATNMPGVYLLTLTPGETDTAGPFVATITAQGCASSTILIDVVEDRVTDVVVLVHDVLRWFTNKLTVTKTEQVLYDDEEAAPLYRQGLSDDGTTVIRETAT